MFVPQVRRGAIGAQCGLVFAYNGASEKFHAEEHFKKFESYDKWKLREFKQFLKTRYKWIFVMYTWKMNVVFGCFAMALELLRIVPSDLKSASLNSYLFDVFTNIYIYIKQTYNIYITNVICLF